MNSATSGPRWTRRSPGANLLGVQQLQGKLVEAARVGITDAANRELDSISRGTLRLEMHRKVKANGQEAELELLVLDRTSVREPIDAAYLSGSQRFRVAVALALGIGQYVGGAARGQRAVIIDEGFGSLDADGIDAMAEHLRDLSDRLGPVRRPGGSLRSCPPRVVVAQPPALPRA